MSKLQQVLLGVIAFLVVFFILIPILPDAYFIRFIAKVVVVIVAIWWTLDLAGIKI